MLTARICPENGSAIRIVEVATGRGETHFLNDVPPEIISEGLVFLALANCSVFQQQDGVVEVPGGATVDIYNHNDDTHLCRLEVHRNGTLPMFHIPGTNHPNSDKPLFHHIEGNGFFSATRLPNELTSLVVIWSSQNQN